MPDEKDKPANALAQHWQRANAQRPATDPLKAFRDAVTDIREKVVEEPWYGRTLSDKDAGADIHGNRNREATMTPAAGPDPEPEGNAGEPQRHDPEPGA